MEKHKELETKRLSLAYTWLLLKQVTQSCHSGKGNVVLYRASEQNYNLKKFSLEPAKLHFKSL